MPTNWSSGYTFPILNSSGASTGVNVDMSDMFVRKDLFLDAGLWGCGYGGGGLQGNNATANYSSPIQVGTLNTWKQVNANGSATALGVKVDGTLWAWGANSQGAVGNGTTTSVSSPVQIGLLNNWKQVSSSALHSAAIKTDGTLWTWGFNNGGQLGNNTQTSSNSPIQIGGLTTWKQVSVNGIYVPASGQSYFYTTAIKTDNTLWAWGVNSSGQLASGSTGYYSSPIQVGSLNTWRQISTGVYHAAAIQQNGTLWTWGFNNYGQLGTGVVNTSYSSPVQVGALTSWVQVACGYNTTYGIQSNGTLWAWGLNLAGQLGNGNSTANYSSPIQVGSLTNWKLIATSGATAPLSAAQGGSAMAIKTDGTLWAWGNNQYGQLGQGVTTYYSSPVQVGSLTDWKTVSGGFAFFAISAPELPD